MQRFFTRRFALLVLPHILMAITIAALLYSIVQNRAVLDEHKQSIMEQRQEIDTLQQQADNAEKVINDLKAEKEQLKGDLDTLGKENADLREEIDGLKKKISIAEQQKKVTILSASQTLKVKASAYVANCREGCTGKTATGIDVRHSTPKLIAVDPKVIPLGSVVELIVGGESWGEYIAGDTGGAIKGNKIDILMKTEKECRNFGVRTIELKIIKRA